MIQDGLPQQTFHIHLKSKYTLLFGGVFYKNLTGQDGWQYLSDLQYSDVFPLVVPPITEKVELRLPATVKNLCLSIGVCFCSSMLKLYYQAHTQHTHSQLLGLIGESTLLL